MFRGASDFLVIPKVMLLACFVAVAGEGPTRAADVAFLCAGGLQPAMKELIPAFQAATGHNVRVSYGNVAVVADRLRKGEAADLIVVSPEHWDDLQKEGKLNPAVRITIAKVGAGVLVKKGAAKPDVGTSDSVKRALLDARSIVTPNPATGQPVGLYAPRLFERLGISADVKPKLVLGSPRQLIVKGDAEIGLWQVSEILEATELDLAGPLPADIQHYTTYTAGTPTNAKELPAAKALVEFLTSPRAATILRSKGLEPG